MAARLGPIGQIVNFAPTGHLFGHLYGVVLPETLGVPVHHGWHHPAAVPTIRPDVATLLVCLPSSWPIVRSMARSLAALPAVVALHGTGPIVPATRTVIERLDGGNFRVVEIFGSTETGAIATRAVEATGSQPLWSLLPDVDLIAEVDGGPQPLRVSSPRLGRNETMADYPQVLVLDDLVEPQAGRLFAHAGRASRLIKVNGVRCDLDAVEAHVALLHPGCEVACVADRDTLRGEHYDLFYSAPAPGPTPEQIWSVFGRFLGPVPLPRSVCRVEGIPRSATGKVLTERVRGLARATAQPTIGFT
ncbi:acyl-CoA synthetase [Nocardia macrotermitis]|uniref:acyl-CoA synthetase n=1 Tax=Nocardia macrotermitis TaxID=2585198 RepID=UPI00188631DC|nr:acyl-CoA synthetase [Nocardia macrotermitis]